METVITFLSGAVTLGYLVAGAFFLKFWCKTHDRLFLAFGVAFALLSVNQILAIAIDAGDEEVVYAYLLRVLGFLLILVAIADKNLSVRRQRETAPKQHT
jgi:1-deoxy-D-xylulose 5-phosphate reductoisomerase